jgi:hypothetical protein
MLKYFSLKFVYSWQLNMPYGYFWTTKLPKPDFNFHPLQLLIHNHNKIITIHGIPTYQSHQYNEIKIIHLFTAHYWIPEILSSVRKKNCINKGHRYFTILNNYNRVT